MALRAFDGAGRNRRRAASGQSQLRAGFAPGNFRNVVFRGSATGTVIGRIPVIRPHIGLIEIGAANRDVEGVPAMPLTAIP